MASFGWEQLLALLTECQAEGTLSIKAPDARLDVVFQGGLAVVPIPPHPELGRSRDVDRKLANRALSQALTWRTPSFVFRLREFPPGFVARRAITLEPERLEATVALLRYRRKLEPSPELEALEREPLKGDLACVQLAALLRSLKKHRRTGSLMLTSAGRQLTVRFEDGRLRGGSTPEQRSLAHEQLRALCASSAGAFCFTPQALPKEPCDAASRQGEKTRRILMSSLQESRATPPKAPRPRRRARRQRRARSKRSLIGRRL